MKHVLAAVLCIAIPLALFASDKDNGYKVTYDGGWVPHFSRSVREVGGQAGTGMKIYIEPNQIRFAKNNADVVKISASAITEISYGQDVHRRIGTAVAVGVFTLGVGALIALSKSMKHPNCHPEAAESRAKRATPNEEPARACRGDLCTYWRARRVAHPL